MELDDKSLIFWAKLDGNSYDEITRASGTDTDITYLPTASGIGKCGYYGQECAYSNGTTSRIDFAHSTAYTTGLAQGFSVAFWVNPATAGEGTPNAGVFVAKSGVQPNSTNGWAIGMRAANNQLYFYVAGDTSGTTNCLSQSNSITLGTWQHVCVTVTAANVKKLFVNGINKSQNTTAAAGVLANMTNTVALTIGNLATLQTFTANALIKDVRIYKRVINDAEIKYIMHGRGYAA